MRFYLLVLGIIILVLCASFGPSTNLVYGNILYITIYLILKIKSRGLKAIDIITLYIINQLIGAFGTIESILNIGSPAESRYFLYGNPLFVKDAAIISFLGNIFFVFGFDVINYAKFPKISALLNENTNFSIITFSSLIIIFLNFYQLLPKLGSFNYVIDLIPIFSILFLSRLSIEKGSRSLQFQSLFLASLQSILALSFTVLRTNIILPFFVYFLGLLAGSKSLKIFFKPVNLIIIIVFMILNSYFADFGEVRSSEVYGIDRVNAIIENKADRTSYVEKEVEYGTKLRFSNVQQLTSIVELVNTNGYYFGTTLKALLIAFVPRFLWPDKPLIAQGVWFALEIGQAEKTDNWYSTSINMTIPGELYLNFGYMGIIFGCSLFGYFLRSLWESCEIWINPLNFSGSILGGFLLYQGIFGIGADIQIIVTMLSIYLLFVLFYKSKNKIDEVSLRGTIVERK
jgi:hypothetical protein